MEEADKKNEGDGQPPTQVAGDVQPTVESSVTSNAVKVSPYADYGV